MRQRLRLPKTVILLGLTSLFTDVGTEMIFPLLPLFLVETLKASPTYLGLVEGTANAIAGLLKLVSGVIADAARRRKPLVLFGYALASAARPFVAMATRPWHVFAVRATDRVGKGIRGAPRDALIADTAGDAAGRAFGFHQAMDNAGAVVGPLLATALLGLGVALRGVFWLAVIPGVIATLLVTAIAEEPRGARTSSPALGATGTARRPLGRPLVAYLVILAIFSLGNSSDAFLLLRARSLGLATESIPLLWAALNLSKVVWAYFGGDLADRMPRVHLIAFGWLIYALVYLGLAAATSPWHVWILFAIYGVFYGLTEPVEKALVRDLCSPSTRGRAYGAYNFVVGTAALPAGLITGAFWKSAGPSVALEIGAGLAAIACLAILAWDHWRARARARG